VQANLILYIHVKCTNTYTSQTDAKIYYPSINHKNLIQISCIKLILKTPRTLLTENLVYYKIQ